MPQMAPMSWMLLYLLFTFLIMFIMIIIYPSNTNNIPKKTENIEISNMNLKW